MKGLSSACLLWILVVMLSLPHAASAQGVPPLEAKRDLLLEKRFSASLAALREKNDTKTLAMLKSMAREYITEMDKLRPLYESWYNALSGIEKVQLLQASNRKRWISLMQEIQFDREILNRFLANPTLQREYENIQFMCERASELSLLEQ